MEREKEKVKKESGFVKVKRKQSNLDGASLPLGKHGVKVKMNPHCWLGLRHQLLVIDGSSHCP